MTYSIDTDILGKLGNIKVASGLLTPSRIFANNQIDIRIKKLYKTPVISTDSADMQYLNDIESDLAAGKLLRAVATQHSLKETSLGAKILIDGAMSRINDILKETIVFDGAPLNTNIGNAEVNFSTIILNTPDKFPSFDRPMSGVENDAINGNYDAKEYNPVEDVKTEDDPYPSARPVR